MFSATTPIQKAAPLAEYTVGIYPLSRKSPQGLCVAMRKCLRKGYIDAKPCMTFAARLCKQRRLLTSKAVLALSSHVCRKVYADAVVATRCLLAREEVWIA